MADVFQALALVYKVRDELFGNPEESLSALPSYDRVRLARELDNVIALLED